MIENVERKKKIEIHRLKYVTKHVQSISTH